MLGAQGEPGAAGGGRRTAAGRSAHRPDPAHQRGKKPQENQAAQFPRKDPPPRLTSSSHDWNSATTALCAGSRAACSRGSTNQ